MTATELKALEDKIKATPVKKGQTFKNFAELCDFIGVKTVKSKGQRDALKKQFSRFFDFESPDPKSRKIVITKTHYKKPKTITSKRTGKHTTPLNTPLMYMLLLNDSAYTATPDEGHTISEFINIIDLRRKFISMTCSQDFFYAWNDMTWDGVKSAITQIGKHKYADKRMFYSDDTMEITPKQYEMYVKTVQEPVLTKHGFKTMGQVAFADAWSSVWPELDEECETKFGFSVPRTKYALNQIAGKDTEYFAELYLTNAGKTKPEIDALKTAGTLVSTAKEMAEGDYWKAATENLVNKFMSPTGFGASKKKKIMDAVEEIRVTK